MFEFWEDYGFYIKFLILFIPITIYVFIFAPSLKWKVTLTLGAFIGIVLALSGVSIRKRK